MKTRNRLNGRIIYFDFLRVFASLGVMLLHISATKWYETDVHSYEWQIFNIGDSVARWTVPVFVMISGAVFLGKNISIERLYKKYIFRIITSFIFWSLIYALIELIQGADFGDFVYEVIKGHNHMWYLYMIVGLYFIVPFIDKMVESPTLIRYFLVLSLVFTFAIPQIINVLLFLNENIGNRANNIWNNFSFHFTLGYIFYFVLGFYLNKIDISKRYRHILYFLSVCGFVITIVATAGLSVLTNRPQASLYGNYTVNVMFESIGVFVLFKYGIGSLTISEKTRTVVLQLSKCSYGAYLVHFLVIEQLENVFGVNTLSFSPIISVLIITLMVFCISYTISYVCNQIPIIKKHMV